MISDIQYADVNDCLSLAGKRRYYRNSLKLLETAISDWQRSQVDMVVHCGDIIDGRNASTGTSAQAMSEVLKRLEGVDVPVKHVLGNHCLANFDREQLIDLLRMDTQRSPDAVGFYSFNIHPRWRIVVLDTCDISTLGRPRDHPHYQAARDILNSKNPNICKYSTDGLKGLERRFAQFNGAVSHAQLEWLEKELVTSEQDRQRVIVFCHIPLLPGTGPKATLVWNYDEVLQVIYRHKVVVAVIAGHTHLGCYKKDTQGIHHLVLPGVVETPPGGKGHGFLDVQEKQLVLRGFGMPQHIRMSLAAKDISD